MPLPGCTQPLHSGGAAASVRDTRPLDHQTAVINAALGEDCWELDHDDGQAIYNRLPAPERHVLAHLARMMRATLRLPSERVVVCLAEHYRADARAALAALGWTPAPGGPLTTVQRDCLALARQIVLGVTFDVELRF